MNTLPPEFSALVQQFRDSDDEGRPHHVLAYFGKIVIGTLLEMRLSALDEVAQAVIRGDVTTKGLRAWHVASPNPYRRMFSAQGDGLPAGGILVSLHLENERPDPEIASLMAELPEELIGSADSETPGQPHKVRIYEISDSRDTGIDLYREIIETDACNGLNAFVAAEASAAFILRDGRFLTPEARYWQYDTPALIESLDQLIRALQPNWTPSLRDEALRVAAEDDLPAYKAAEAAALMVLQSTQGRGGDLVTEAFRRAEEGWMTDTAAEMHAGLIEMLEGLVSRGHESRKTSFVFDDNDGRAWYEPLDEGRHLVLMSDDKRRYVVLLRDGEHSFPVVTRSGPDNAWPSRAVMLRCLDDDPSMTWGHDAAGLPFARLGALDLETIQAAQSLTRTVAVALAELLEPESMPIP